jgi:predicted nucleic acid-binding protein
MEPVIPELDRARRISLDTAPFIYFIEVDPRFAPLVRPLLEAISLGEKQAVSSIVTLAELLVKPIQQQRLDLARRYRDTLMGQPHLRLVSVESDVAEEAARIRARYGFRLPDAIQLATAALEDAEVFVTNDARLRSFDEVRVVVLDDHLGGA